jgi:hypothetical protein
MQQHPEWFKNKYKLFFGKHFKVANRAMSLDDIEHDMLRKSTLKWSLGYIRNPFPSQFEQSFQVFELDPRIHFALNCGAVSCPPIRFYTAANVPEQLEMATINYLVHDTVFDTNKNEYQVTKLNELVSRRFWRYQRHQILFKAIRNYTQHRCKNCL